MQNLNSHMRFVHKRIRARHEIVNGKLKRFKVLRDKFRHSLRFHAYCSFAVQNIVKILIDEEEPLFAL